MADAAFEKFRLRFRFREIARHSQKKLQNIQEIVKKVYHDKALMRMWL
jgi:hypothetical protein